MDQFNYALGALGDQSMRMVIAFEGHLDELRLQEAAAAVLAGIPVLGSRFVEGDAPYWEHLQETAYKGVVDVHTATGDNDDLSRILGLTVDSATGPQIRFHVLRTQKSDTLCIATHHAAMDARGLLACTRMIADQYRDPGHAPDSEWNPEDRSLAAVLARFPGASDIGEQPAPEGPPEGWAFPAECGKEYTRAFAIRTLPPARLDAIKRAGHREGATVTDVLLAAYFLALCKTIRPAPAQLLPVMVSIDLRRYLNGTAQKSPAGLISNQSVAFPVMMAPEAGTMDGAIAHARAAMEVHMAHNPGISSAVDLEQFGYDGFARICARVQAMKETYAARRANPPFLANIGIIPEETVAFSPDLPVAGACITGIVIDPPGVVLAVTTFRGRLTLVMGYGTPAIPRDIMERFMDTLTGYLPGGDS